MEDLEGAHGGFGQEFAFPEGVRGDEAALPGDGRVGHWQDALDCGAPQ